VTTVTTVTTLPVDLIVDGVASALREGGAVIVVAPPGTGKTTRLPLLLQGFFPEGRIIITEPRRLAARAAADRMAGSLGEPTGRSVGYRMRDETNVSVHTRIEVVTEGVLVRMLTDDSSLDGVAMVILDEVHERHLDTDLSLALLLDVRAVLRPDLKIVLMSATLDDDRLTLLIDAPVIRCTAPLHPVTVDWQPSLLSELPDRAAVSALEVMSASHGDLLLFAPGAREIRAIMRALERRRLPGGVDVRVTAVQVSPNSAPQSPDRTPGDGRSCWPRLSPRRALPCRM
jgi:ATP-dependent helicase HrpB